MTIWIILIILAVLGVWFVSIYNKLVNQKTHVDEGWSGIDVQLKRRYDLVPNLVETVKGYSIHEKSIFENVAKARSVAMGATSIDEKSKAEAGLSGALKTLFAVAENYPDLKANANFMQLQKDLNSIEQDLQLARRYYNGTARDYNMTVASFPSNVVAKVVNFERAPFFELSSEAEKQSPQVKF